MTIHITPPRENIIRHAFTGAARHFITPEIEEEIGRRMRRAAPKISEKRPRFARGEGAYSITDADMDLIALLPDTITNAAMRANVPRQNYSDRANRLFKRGLIEPITEGPGRVFAKTPKYDEIIKSGMKNAMDRQKRAKELAAQGHSISRIASVMQVSRKTIARDLAIPDIQPMKEGRKA